MLLLANIELSTIFFGVVDQFMVLLPLDHLVAAYNGEVTILLCDCLVEPGVLVDGASVEVSHLELGFVRLDLVGEALVLVDDHSSVTFNFGFGIS